MRELLHLDEERAAPDPNYAGYGWARVRELWLDERRVDDALVVAVHSADDSEPIADDVELEFELPGAQPVSVLASLFLAKWLPRLPHTNALVLALCNPHRATLAPPSDATLYYANGDVESWVDHDRDRGDRIQLTSEHGWVRRDS
ncbi:MAG TPA: hypothetical protein VFV99_22420 [Kofleriaceae bacterium]|nr:hypothetical protein [Kofleriaceae bacterium]